jgi:hypothetical protein
MKTDSTTLLTLLFHFGLLSIAAVGGGIPPSRKSIVRRSRFRAGLPNANSPIFSRSPPPRRDRIF